MPIFPNLEIEGTLQVNDKTRLDGRKTFITPDESAITLIEICADDGAGAPGTQATAELNGAPTAGNPATVTLLSNQPIAGNTADFIIDANGFTPADGDTVTFTIGMTMYTFEFDNNMSVGMGNISVPISGANGSATNLRNAIIANLTIPQEVDSVNEMGGFISGFAGTNFPGVSGNSPTLNIVKSGGLNWVISDFSGGANALNDFADGDSYIISVGADMGPLTTYTFEFDDNMSVGGGNISVEIDDTLNNEITWDNLNTAIGANIPAADIVIQSSDSMSQTMVLAAGTNWSGTAGDMELKAEIGMGSSGVPGISGDAAGFFTGGGMGFGNFQDGDGFTIEVGAGVGPSTVYNFEFDDNMSVGGGNISVAIAGTIGDSIVNLKAAVDANIATTDITTSIAMLDDPLTLTAGTNWNELLGNTELKASILMGSTAVPVVAGTAGDFFQGGAVGGGGCAFIDVTTNKYLDWEYSAAGTKTVTVRVTTDGTPVTAEQTIEVITAVTDKLFSADAELTEHEGDILSYVRPGRNSWLDKHRGAQDRIIGWLDEHRINDTSGDRLTKAAVVDIQEVNDWSKFLTLQMIFESVSNAVDDVFSDKAKTYGRLVEQSRNRAVLRLDRNGDGTISDSEHQDNFSYRMVRR